MKIFNYTFQPTDVLLQILQRFLNTKEKRPSVAKNVTALCKLTINRMLLSFQLTQFICDTFQRSVKFSLTIQDVLDF